MSIEIPENLLKKIVQGEEVPEQYSDLYDQFKIVYTEIIYEAGDPTDIWVLKHIPTGGYYRIANYRDSWGGGYWEPEITFVEPKQVEVTQYHIAVEKEDPIKFFHDREFDEAWEEEFG